MQTNLEDKSELFMSNKALHVALSLVFLSSKKKKIRPNKPQTNHVGTSLITKSNMKFLL